MPTKERIGIVISNKMQKTIVIAVENKSQSRYAKFKFHTKSYLAHDEFNQCNIGDQVIIKETRPLSKRKCWILKEVLYRSTL